MTQLQSPSPNPPTWLDCFLMFSTGTNQHDRDGRLNFTFRKFCLGGGLITTQRSTFQDAMCNGDLTTHSSSLWVIMKYPKTWNLKMMPWIHGKEFLFMFETCFGQI